jgi:hypothetical protein
MGTMTKVVKQLKTERDRVEKQLLGLNAALSAFAGAYSGAKATPKRPKMSAQARAKISAAQKARWKAWKAKKGK